MNPAIRTTLLMGFFTAVICAAAAVYYPWPDSAGTDRAMNQGLYAEFDADRVWGLEIVQFNPDKQLNVTFSLQRRGDRWLAPAQSGFPTDFVARRSAVINALIALTNSKGIFEQRSDEQEDHVKYGVVDPGEFQQTGNRAGIGTRVTLEDKNRQTLASLIVGLPLVDDQRTGQAFVRITGQPQVYVVQINPDVLSVEFGDWVDPNLFGLQTELKTDGEPVSEVAILNSAASSGNRDPSTNELAWRAIAGLGGPGGGLVFKGVQLLVGDKADFAEPNDLIARSVANAASSIAAFAVTDVRGLPDATAESLSGNGIAGDAALYAPLLDQGFVQKAAEGSPLEFECPGGRIEVETTTGMRLSMLFGNAFSESRARSKQGRCAILFARSIPESFPEPSPPASGATDEQLREHNRAVEAREKSLAAVTERVQAFNRRHSRWLYVLDEEIVQRVIPDLQGLKPPASAGSASEPDTGNSGTAGEETGDGESAAGDTAVDPAADRSGKENVGGDGG